MLNENKVRQHVAAAVRKADLNTVSAKQIRRSVEKELGLSQDELAEGKWKRIVKDVIEETMAAIEGDVEEPEKPVEESEEEAVARKSSLDWLMGLAKVRRKKAVIQNTPESSPAKPKPSPKKASPPSPFTKPSIQNHSPQNSPSSATKKKRKIVAEDDSDSDMSVLNDSAPPVSKSRKPSKEVTSKTKSSKPASSKPVASKPATSSTEDEIKNLKSLVFKCGVRKNWSLPINYG
jgi:hypothetical protein